MPLAVLILSGGFYAAGIITARRAGHRWLVLPTLGFYLLGLGSYAWVSFGFLGAYSVELRWAFTTRIALLLFVVPGLVTLGKPVALMRLALSGMPIRVVDGVLNSWPVKLLGNAVFAPLLEIGAFMVFLTPLAYVIRDSTGWEWSIAVFVPLAGLFMVLPISENTMTRTSLFITAEFMLAFVELVVDNLPGILLRLNNAVLDHAPAITGAVASWWPSPLHDQHLSGDFLWFLAEFSDIPILIILFMRWIRSDRHEADKMDELSDEEMEALTTEHLRHVDGR